MPHVASATGELILRKFGMSSGALASGQGENLNKVLMTRAGNDRRMVNAPPAVANKSTGYHTSTGQNPQKPSRAEPGYSAAATAEAAKFPASLLQ
jgi:hypothetical protein